MKALFYPIYIKSISIQDNDKECRGMKINTKTGGIKLISK
jgi:hypothetical protein